MRNDTTQISFTSVAQGGTLAEVDVSDVFQVGFGVRITSVTGSPTNYRIYVIPVEDVPLGGVTQHIRKTADLTTTTTTFLGQRESAVGEIAIENVYKRLRVVVDFTGGTSPTISGSVYVFTKRL